MTEKNVLMHFDKVAWSSFSAKVNDMANILGGNFMVFSRSTYI